MRSKRSKAWHRRKDEIARARALIERGIDTPPRWPQQIGAIAHTTMERIVKEILENRAFTPMYVARDPGKPLRFRPFDPTEVFIEPPDESP